MSVQEERDEAIRLLQLVSRAYRWGEEQDLAAAMTILAAYLARVAPTADA